MTQKEARPEIEPSDRADAAHHQAGDTRNVAHDRDVGRGNVRHVNGLSALRASTRDVLSPTAARLLTWVALRASKHGAVWAKREVLARELGTSWRTIVRAAVELEGCGLLERELVVRGSELPDGTIAAQHAQVLRPVNPTPAGVIRGDKNATPPGVISRDRFVTPDEALLPFKEKRLNSRRSADPDRGETAPPSLSGRGPREPDAQGEFSFLDVKAKSGALGLYEAWRAAVLGRDAHAPSETAARDALAIIDARLAEGTTERAMRDALLGALSSPHNRSPERRTIAAVWGTPGRVRALANVGELERARRLREQPRDLEPRAPTDAASVAEALAHARRALAGLTHDSDDTQPEHQETTP